MKNRRIWIGIVVAFFAVHMGAAEKGTSAVSKETVARTVGSIATPQSFISNQVAKIFKHKTGKELMQEKTEKKVTPSAVSATASKTAKTPAGLTKPTAGYVPPPPTVTPPPKVAQIRQEVQRILELNSKIKNLQSNQTLQMQRIQEQARLHQKILDQLETTRMTQNAKKVNDRNSLLAQEKLRIIHEETQRNQAILKSVQSSSAAQGRAGMKAVIPEEIPTTTKN